MLINAFFIVFNWPKHVVDAVPTKISFLAQCIGAPHVIPDAIVIRVGGQLVTL